ncbi:MAG: biotin--[acetyl-CoA-carboxylase] ligase [Dehalococcoidia bacterium]
MTDILDIERVQSLLTTGSVGRHISYEASVSSTMDVAKRQAEADPPVGGAPDGAVVIAEEQTAGRGRLGRTWVSPPGVNLYFTIILRPELAQLRELAVIGPLAVCQAIEETTALLPRIKWPNDVVIDNRKVCGVLPTSEVEDERVLYALVGIGINVNLDVAAHGEIAEIATSLHQELDHEVSREEVLAATLNHFETLYRALCDGQVVSVAWKQRLDTLGRPVRVEMAGGVVEEGTAVDADSDGSLIVRRDDGSHVRLEAGEAFAREG